MNRDILRLALPSIVSNITVPLLSLVDIAIMGHAGDASCLAAISVGAMIFNVMYWILGFLRMGTSGMTSQALGRGDCSAIRALFSGSLRLALLMGLFLVASFVPIREFMLWAFQVGEAEIELVSTYYHVCILAAPAVLGSFALSGWLIGMQNTRIPMQVSIGQNVLNILLSLVFVFGLDMQIVGVALGTMLSQWMAFLVQLWLARCKFGAQAGGLSDLWRDFNFSILGNSGGKTYLNIFLRTLCLVAVNLYFTSAGSAQGAVVLAANTLLMTFFTMFSYIMDGFAFAAEAIGGRLYGAGDHGGVGQLHRQLMLWGVGLVAVFTVGYALTGERFLGVLTDEASVVALAREYYHYVLLVPACGVMAFVYDGLFIGMTRTREMLFSTLIASVFFFAVSLLWAEEMGNSVLWVALLGYLLLRGIVLFFIFKRGALGGQKRCF